jgi:hypothetical protein
VLIIGHASHAGHGIMFRKGMTIIQAWSSKRSRFILFQKHAAANNSIVDTTEGVTSTPGLDMPMRVTSSETFKSNCNRDHYCRVLLIPKHLMNQSGRIQMQVLSFLNVRFDNKHAIHVIAMKIIHFSYYS